MTLPGRTASPAAALRRLSRTRPQTPAQERCDLCAAPLGDEHPHVVDLESRGLMCSCRPCFLLFTDEDADQRFRAVPERCLSFGGAVLDARTWDELQIPVGLAFLFHNSALGRTVAFYPGPAGATESELPLEAWQSATERHPELTVVRPDVEALLVHRTDDGAYSCHLVPIDACYQLVGTLRSVWRGFDGGREAHAAMDAFFARVADRSRPYTGDGAP
ncbi:DUF5947 family protein [Streptomyces sp. NPDC047002]|uniref:DUF5947 family protein n=1 Tax=Streptomyces sp. NPDC047002 TaxID=3155475 RepID=UPI003452C52D